MSLARACFLLELKLKGFLQEDINLHIGNLCWLDKNTCDDHGICYSNRTLPNTLFFGHYFNDFNSLFSLITPYNLIDYIWYIP